MKFLGFMMAFGLFAALSYGAESRAAKPAPKAEPKVKYRGQQVDFESMLVQGQIRRPEISVVTGNTQQGSNGLLRLRKDFADRFATDAGEEL